MTEVYRGRGGLPIFLLGHLFTVAFGAAFLAGTTSARYDVVLVGFSALFLGLALLALVFEPYKVSLASDNTMTFHSLLRGRVVHVEDVRSIRRVAGEGAVWMKFKFIRGSARVTHWRRVDALIARLRSLNPAIRYED